MVPPRAKASKPSASKPSAAKPSACKPSAAKPSACKPSACKPSPRRSPRPTRSYASLFKALSDETRLEIVGLLAAAEGELCVCEIESHFALSQPTVSHHLKVLRDAGVASSERRGTWVFYQLAPTATERVSAFVELLGTASASWRLGA